MTVRKPDVRRDRVGIDGDPVRAVEIHVVTDPAGARTR